ncbi:AraC-like DNA-binding protein [Prauserella sediminis]|uniref:AraC-like DNA-binding protein n=1 Tax=Prauserella sediminis TaxID=577680 RepID=A0A839XVU1_9PSEU|nr:AraC family transcriptional regulator [Prauserella sediminis]MBB3664643.1 AraC-like DNA-binding protein [Prauserella sediminis]
MPTARVATSAEELPDFSAAVADAYFPHELTVLRDGVGPAELRKVDLGPVRLTRIGWGAEVSVRSDHPGGWAVNVPRSGLLDARVSGRSVLSLEGQATVCPPDTHTLMSRWSADCSILGMRVDAEYLADELVALVGLTAQDMPAQLDLRTEAAQAWLALLTSIGAQSLRSPDLLARRAVRERLGATLTAAFVTACFPAEPETGDVCPRIVARVVDAMEADPARAWGSADIARCAGVGIRRVQQSFQRYRGETPTEALRRIRLRRVHEDLLHDRVETVADGATRWGFMHLGRFAAAYRREFGVSPSATLRR